MKLKSLHELNQEFQKEVLAMHQEIEDTELDLMEPAVIETDRLDISKPEPDLNELYERALRRLKNNGEEKKNRKDIKKKRNIFAVISDLFFYLAIFTVLIAIFTSWPKEGSPNMLMGYAYFTVASSSMQKEIPKGSLIFVKKTEAQNLNIGDNITFIKEDGIDTITHKIVDIYDNYLGSGARGFQTKGVNNPDPDKNIVHAENIVGKVVTVLPGLGAAVSAIRSNIYIIFIIFGLFVVLSFLIRALFAGSAKLKIKRTEMSEIQETNK